MRRMVLCYSSLPANANAINYSSAAPLHMATLYNSESCTTLLRQKGDVNRSTSYGYMPLQYAAKNDCYKACRLLCRIEETNLKGLTVYHLNEELNVNSQNYYKTLFFI